MKGKDNMADIITQEELMNQLKTRGFEDGFQRTPLRDFKGRLLGIKGEMRQPKA
jgi:hypothetical protein